LMTKYFFDVRVGDDLMIDDTGIDFEDLEAATAEARRAAGEIANEALRRGDDGPVEIKIRDHSGPVLLCVSWDVAAADSAVSSFAAIEEGAGSRASLSKLNDGESR
jgi:hypothetical protein